LALPLFGFILRGSKFLEEFDGRQAVRDGEFCKEILRAAQSAHRPDFGYISSAFPRVFESAHAAQCALPSQELGTWNQNVEPERGTRTWNQNVEPERGTGTWNAELGTRNPHV
jgi:hypothetical protein